MTLSTTHGALNYSALLEKVTQARKVLVATYGLGNCLTSPLLRAISKMSRGAKATLILNVPNRMLADTDDREFERDEDMEMYIRAFAPANFQCALDVWFCFDNHAKVLIADNNAYVGSANFTTGSAHNFEAGYVLSNSDDIGQLEGFLEEMKEASVPYSTVQGSRQLRTMMQFAATVPAFLEIFDDLACDWREDPFTQEGSYVPSAGHFRIPPRLNKAVVVALEAIATVQGASIGANTRGLAAKESRAAIITLTWLKEVTEEIEAGTVIPPEVNESKLLEYFVQKYLHLSPDGRVGQVVHDAAYKEVLEVTEANRKERAHAAQRMYEDIRKGLTLLRKNFEVILRASQVNPQLRRTKSKYRSRRF